jgi:hypothetical protein
VPPHTPPAHTSFFVHAFPSLHEAVLYVCVHPVVRLQESVVHGFPSSQFGPAPPTHFPPAQASPVVHALPSSHASVLFECVHPVAGLQASVVHTFESSQFVAGPPTHFPAVHMSPVVHALPSSHEVVLLFGLQSVWLVVGVHCWHAFVGLVSPAA